MSDTNKSIKVSQNVKILIDHIQTLYLSSDPILNGVNDVEMLYDALCDLDEIVGMYEIKKSIITLIKYLLMNGNDNNDNTHKLDEHMLHTMILGPPGVGKTSIGSVLAKIWNALGLVKKIQIEYTKQDKCGETISNNDNNNINGINPMAIIPIPIYIYGKDITYSYSEKKDTEEKSDVDDDGHDVPSSTSSPATPKSNKPILIKRPLKPLSSYKSKSNHTDNSMDEILKINKKDYISLHSKESADDEIAKNLASIMSSISSNGSDDSYESIHEEDNVMELENEIIKLRKQMRSTKMVTCAITEKYSPIQPVKLPLKRAHNPSPIIVVSRPDFIGTYIGHTCDKTQKLLISTLEEGKVLFIDEAYSLVLDDKDSFGHEALNEINRFMSEHPELIIIFAGYKDKMDETLFRYQPGFKRRCTWIFEITKYEPFMMSHIFTKQLVKSGWSYGGDINELNNFFKDKMQYFKAFGGDTLRLALYCKLEYSNTYFDSIGASNLTTKTINKDILIRAYDNMYFKPEMMIEENSAWKDMYI
jgi:hypothetical protein